MEHGLFYDPLHLYIAPFYIASIHSNDNSIQGYAINVIKEMYKINVSQILFWYVTICLKQTNIT